MRGPKAVYAAEGRIYGLRFVYAAEGCIYGLRSHRPYRPVQIPVVYTAGVTGISNIQYLGYFWPKRTQNRTKVLGNHVKGQGDHFKGQIFSKM